MNVLPDIGMVQYTTRLRPQQLMIARICAISMKIVNFLHMETKMDIRAQQMMNLMVVEQTIASLYMIMILSAGGNLHADGIFTPYNTLIGASMAFPTNKEFAVVPRVEHAEGLGVPGETGDPHIAVLEPSSDQGSFVTRWTMQLV